MHHYWRRACRTCSTDRWQKAIFLNTEDCSSQTALKETWSGYREQKEFYTSIKLTFISKLLECIVCTQLQVHLDQTVLFQNITEISSTHFLRTLDGTLLMEKMQLILANSELIDLFQSDMEKM